MGTKVFYQVRIQEDTELGQFNDALYFTPDEWLTVKQEDIDAAVKTRVESWISFVKEASSKVPDPPKPEDLKDQAEQLKLQWEQMVTALASVGTKADLELIQDKLDEAVATTATAIDAKPIDAVPIAEEPVIP
jgi:hypothetical protein